MEEGRRESRERGEEGRLHISFVLNAQQPVWIKTSAITGSVNHFVHTFTDASGHIISDVPGITGRPGSFNIRRPPPGDPAGADQTPACVQIAS